MLDESHPTSGDSRQQPVSGAPRSLREFARVVAACALLLALGDQLHVQFGVISYPSGVFFGQAWWVAPGFALATVGFIALAWRPAARIVPPTPSSILRDGAWFFGSYAASAVLGPHVLLVTVLLGGAWLARVVRRPDRRVVIAFSLILALVGTVSEILLHATGVCSYTNRELLLVPAWLPTLYLQGAPLALSVTRWLRGDFCDR